MDPTQLIDSSYEARIKHNVSKLRWGRLHLDPYLFFSLILLACIGIFILYSASDESSSMVMKQALRFGLAFTMMLVAAQISPQRYLQWGPWLYAVGIVLLLMVLIIGRVDQGARRWLNLGLFHLQPSEIMKLAMPMALAWFLHDKKLPPILSVLIVSGLMLVVPVLLIMKQPDLGTAIIVASSAFAVLLLAGIGWRLIGGLFLSAVISTPVLWHFMHQYQKDRVLTFLSPERDPLGTGYHIIQSKIAIGSGGVFGKGWLNGTQSHLSFLPAHSTDFIFAVSGEELGMIGCIFILLVFLLIFLRCLYISTQAQDTFSRLLAGSFSITFILSALVNIGMVIGILPVVGIPLPLISYGGTSMVTTMVGFGMIMSVHTHKKLWSS